jgi:hypothetical protein
VDTTRPWGAVLLTVDLQATTNGDLHMPTEGRAVVDDAQTRLAVKEENLFKGVPTHRPDRRSRCAGGMTFTPDCGHYIERKDLNRRDDCQDGPRRKSGDTQGSHPMMLGSRLGRLPFSFSQHKGRVVETELFSRAWKFHDPRNPGP